MQAITNEAYLRRRARIAWLLMLGGVAIMVVGAIRYYRGGSPITRPLALIVGGLVVGNIGLYFSRRWLSKPRPEQTLKDALSEFSDRYRLYSYTPPAPHLLISPSGVYVLTVQRQYGHITYEKGRWRRGGHWMQSFLQMNFGRLGNPTKQAEKEADRVRAFISQELSGQEAPVHSVIVFTHPQAFVKAEEAPIPAAHIDELKNVLREVMKEQSGGLRRRQRRPLERALDELAGQK